MNRRLIPVLALAAAAPCATRAQEPATAGSVVVTGKRESVRAGLQLKRQRDEVSDAVLAEEIGKLPDFKLSDALQRITGVQAVRDRGEGFGLTMRGLTQVVSTLNGREVFTAGTGRALDFADIPAEMVAAVTVLKSASADQLEGGIYGWLDASVGLRLSDKVSVTLEGTNLLRTRRDACYGAPTRPQGSLLNDRQLGARVTVQL
jgi:iron complex outermembrane receptor protein